MWDHHHLVEALPMVMALAGRLGEETDEAEADQENLLLVIEIAPMAA